jgi:uncharacterized damage-inducible protein DinB
VKIVVEGGLRQYSGMHPHLANALGHLDTARARLRAAVDAVPPGRRAQRPGEDRWSVAEILEHLSLVELRFAAIIAKRIAEAREAGLGPEGGELEPFPANLRQMLTDRAKRRTAPEPVQPRAGLDEAAAWAELERARAALRATVLAADGLALSQVFHNHPVFGTLNVYQLMEFIAGHEARHTRQVAGIAEEPT